MNRINIKMMKNFLAINRIKMLLFKKMKLMFKFRIKNKQGKSIKYLGNLSNTIMANRQIRINILIIKICGKMKQKMKI